MKFDKETFSRHRFWFSLGGFVLLWLIGFVTVTASAPGKIKGEKKKYDDPSTGLDKQQKDVAKNESFWDPYDKQAEFLKSRIAVVHGDAWKLQEPKIRFPGSNRQPLDKWWANADKFDDWYKRIKEGPGKDAALDEYRDRLYRQQFDDMYRQLRGTEEKEINNLANILDPVEFKGGSEGFKTMMAPTLGSGAAAGSGPGERNPRAVAPPANRGAAPGGRSIDGFFTKRPSADEVWYAQEDFWIKSEMLYAVRRTLIGAGKMTREEPGFWANLGEQAQHPDRVFTPYTPIEGRPEIVVEKDGKKTQVPGGKYLPAAECRFRNLNWQLHLAFVEDDNGKVFVSNHSTLRNVHPSHRVQAGTGMKSTEKAKETKETKAALEFRLTQRKTYYKLNEKAVKALGAAGMPDKVLKKLEPVREKDQYNARGPLLEDLKKALSAEELKQYQDLVVSNMKGEEAPKSWTLEVKTQDLAWNSAAEFGEAKEVDTTLIDPKQPFEVEQVFDWRTSPIRRIDDIRTCYHSHRDANVALKQHPGLKPPEDTSGNPNAPGAAPPGAGPGAPGAPGGMGDPAQGGMGVGAAALSQATEFNSLERNRYLNVTQTCRDVPFTMVLVLDQPHLHDFLVQLANSHLRVQITQVHFRRVRDVGPTLSGDEGEPGEAPRLTPPRPGIERGERRERGGERGNVPAVAEGAADPNLVEVTVYGIAAMYEKFSNQKP
jgi:hypothetical protein